MNKLNVRFSDTQAKLIDQVSKATGLGISKVSRAAMQLGLSQIVTLNAKDKKEAREMVQINDAISK